MNQQVKDSLETLSFARKKFKAIIENLSLEQLNKIPSGFNNNIIWNIIHSPVSTSILVYGPSGNDLPLSEWVDNYCRATKPDPSSPVSAEMLNEVKAKLTDSYGRLVSDYQTGLFKDYQPYQTEFGVELTSAEYAILYAIQHEMFHLGYAMAIRRSLI